MKFWAYLAERQKQKTIRKLAEIESKRVEKIMADNQPAIAERLLQATENATNKYLNKLLPDEPK